MKTKIIIFLFIFIISCKFLSFKKRVVNEKYREKTNIKILKIDSIDGNIDIIGWAHDSVEIGTQKEIFSGLSTDLNLMDTLFEKNERELYIKTKIPTRINGKIDLKIYLPYTGLA